MRIDNYIAQLIILSTVFLSCSLSRNPSDHLNQMALTLNSAAPKFKENYDPKGFYVIDRIPKNFFVFDLIDTLANAASKNSPINIKSSGVYHFAPMQLEYSFSHIAVLENNKMKIFRFLNCPNGDKIESVIKLLKSESHYSDLILDKIKNYRKYGRYVAIDPQSYVDCP